MVCSAENSQSPIHMSEFFMIEAEESFINGVEDMTKRIEDSVCFVTEKLLNNNHNDINAVISAHNDVKNDSIAKKFEWLNKRPFPLIQYSEAIDILKKYPNEFTSPVSYSSGLSKQHEIFLVKHIGSPIFVVNWPKNIKPFYMRQCKDDENLVEAIDFLMPKTGELAGGSVREDNIDRLSENIPSDLKWYLDLRKYGGSTTGGFGIGFDRYLQIILGIHSIKDCIPFPRWPHHCDL